MVALCTVLLAMTTQNPRTDPAERDAVLAKAQDAMRAAVGEAQADPDRPTYHLHAPAQWMNDPNGPIFYKGWYHVFYQLTPDSAQSGIKYWGHFRSRDLVHWQDEPIALWPSGSAGEESIWSGSVFPGPGGKPVAFYTSIGHNREPEQWIATPEDDDLVRWRKDPVHLTQAIHGDKPLVEWRDPFLFNDFGLTFLVTGGGRDGHGIVALYKATHPDLRHWQYLGNCFTHPDAGVRNVECPNLFPLDGKWVLLTSIWPHVDAFVGELRNTTFVSEHRSILAPGSYASQIFAGTDGRAIELAWVPTDAHKSWNGYLTLPSELHVAKDGTLLRTPVKELNKLRGKETKHPDAELDGTLDLPEGDSLEIEATIRPAGATKVGLRLRSGDLTVVYEPATRRLTAGGQSVVLSESSVKKGLSLRVFLDKTALDVYAADGAATLVARVDHSPADHRETQLFSEGGKAQVRGVVVHEIVPPKA